MQITSKFTIAVHIQTTKLAGVESTRPRSRQSSIIKNLKIKLILPKGGDKRQQQAERPYEL